MKSSAGLAYCMLLPAYFYYYTTMLTISSSSSNSLSGGAFVLVQAFVRSPLLKRTQNRYQYYHHDRSGYRHGVFTTNNCAPPNRLAITSTVSPKVPRPSSAMALFGWNNPNHNHLQRPEILFGRRRTDQRSFTSLIFMTSDDDDGVIEEGIDEKNVDSVWNIPGLRKEAGRLTLRCHKKVGKATTRWNVAKAQVEELLTNPDVTVEQMEEECPNVDALELELKQWRDRLGKLNQLEQSLQEQPGKSKNTVLPLDIAQLALDLDVNDEPPKRPARGPKKKKGPRTSEVIPRKPYRKFFSVDQTEIRVGKQAPDNDELSCNPKHRDGADWWMHASGCAGSHIVIRCHDENLKEEVVLDAAALAARQSKCTGNAIKVSLTRCRDVSKPRGAKAGLVQLTGKVRTVAVDMKKAQSRLDRLDETCLIN
mmetsp:Transcript_7757/g.7332  ORF Transcript_7757/g.7332 Transcript_7757/m.7332 type:complete len:423 (-) Transcript_7757:173-1441(-)